MVLSDVISQPNATAAALNQLISTATTNPTADSTGISSFVLAIVGIASVFVEWLRRRQSGTGLAKQSNCRSNSFNESTKDVTASLRKTDEAVSDHAHTFKELIELLLSDNNLRQMFQQKGSQFLDRISRDVIHWDKDLDAYYSREETPILPEEKSTDDIILETVKTRKLLKPDYNAIQATTEKEVSDTTDAMLKKYSPTQRSGGNLEGGVPPLRIFPSNTNGPPTSGNHDKGEFLLDNHGVLYFCGESGTPGIWKRVALVAL